MCTDHKTLTPVSYHKPQGSEGKGNRADPKTVYHGEEKHPGPNNCTFKRRNTMKYCCFLTPVATKGMPSSWLDNGYLEIWRKRTEKFINKDSKRGIFRFWKQFCKHYKVFFLKVIHKSIEILKFVFVERRGTLFSMAKWHFALHQKLPKCYFNTVNESPGFKSLSINIRCQSSSHKRDHSLCS